MSALRRTARIFAGLVAGHFVAVNVLLAGKVLSDVMNLHYYSMWAYWGGPVIGYVVRVAFYTVELFLLGLVPAIVVLVFTETLRIRTRWFYITVAGLGSALLDTACTSFDGLVSARSFCVTLSASEILIAGIAGVAAGFTFWRIAGRRSGYWSVRTANVPLSSV
jgi:hypothetical protein